MKLTSNQLKETVRAVVREELRQLLPALLAECLAERFLKTVVAEVVKPRPAQPAKPSVKLGARSLRELAQEDVEAGWEEETPEALPNDHQGIYHQSPLVRGKGGGSARANESRRRISLESVMGDPSDLMADPRRSAQPALPTVPAGMAALFEGTRPAPPANPGAPLGETQQQFGEEGVPLDFLGKLGVDFGSANRAARDVPEAAALPVDDTRLKQLEARRKSLEVRAG